MTSPDRRAVDRRYLRLALSLGERHLGRTWPNPSVGAVVVAGEPGRERIIGQAATAPGGRPHAEPLALAMAGEDTRGASLYVGLEPCSHHGRSPPCTEAIVAAGITRVISAMEDPNPLVAGSGHKCLRQAGIAVETNLMSEEAGRVHRGHVARVLQGRPSVHLKLACTSDGYAASSTRERLQITGPIANGAVHLWRAHADAIMVGIGTVQADNPSLTVRLPGLEGRSPARIVLDSRLMLNPASHLVRGARDVPTHVLTTRAAPTHARRMLTSFGIEVTTVAADTFGRVDLRAALGTLAEKGFSRVCSEGGPHLAEALAAADLVDVFTLITGPGRVGEGGLPALGPHLAHSLASGHLREIEAHNLGPDRAVIYDRA